MIQNLYLTNPKITLKDGPILFVDDDPDQEMIIRHSYKKAAIHNPIEFLLTGFDLIEYLGQVLEAKKPAPALILLDINMPQIDGFETLKRIRDLQANSGLFIIMLTSSDNLSEVEKSIALGATGYWSKPWDTNEYVEFFNSLPC